jgi:hypothetical protein
MAARSERKSERPLSIHGEVETLARTYTGEAVETPVDLLRNGSPVACAQQLRMHC